MLCSKCEINERAPRGSWCRPCRREAQRAYNTRVRPRPEVMHGTCLACAGETTWVSGQGPAREYCSTKCKREVDSKVRRERLLAADPDKLDRAERDARRRSLDAQKLRKCVMCHEVKSFANYSRRGESLQSRCKECQSKYDADNLTAARRRRHKAHVMRRFQLTLEVWDGMLIAQQGRCAACNMPMHEPHVDHWHGCCDGHATCGKCVRGMLCEDCNLSAGKAKDDPKRLRALADYIERTNRDVLGRYLTVMQ